MTDIFAEILADDGPVAREIKRGAKSSTVHIRRLTAGERLKLAGNQKMTFGGDGQRGSMEMSLSEMAKNRHQMVQFCTVNEDGSQVFRSIDDVQAKPDWLISQLHEFAQEVNKEEGDDEAKND